MTRHSSDHLSLTSIQDNDGGELTHAGLFIPGSCFYTSAASNFESRQIITPRYTLHVRVRMTNEI